MPTANGSRTTLSPLLLTSIPSVTPRTERCFRLRGASYPRRPAHRLIRQHSSNARGEFMGARAGIEFTGRLAEGRPAISQQDLAAFNVSIAKLRSGDAGPAAATLIEHGLSRLRADMPQLVSDWRASPIALRTALLPLALVGPYFRALERSAADPRNVRDVLPLTRVTRIWLAHRFKILRAGG